MHPCPVIDRRGEEVTTDNLYKTYELSSRCSNCGGVSIGVFCKGHKPRPFDHDCPHCEVAGCVQYGTSEYARNLRRTHYPEPLPIVEPTAEEEPPTAQAALPDAPAPIAPITAFGIRIYDDGKGPHVPGCEDLWLSPE